MGESGVSGIAGVCANTGITAPKPLIEPLRRAEEGLECPPRRAPETDSGQKSMVKPYRATFAYLISVSLRVAELPACRVVGSASSVVVVSWA